MDFFNRSQRIYFYCLAHFLFNFFPQPFCLVRDMMYSVCCNVWAWLRFYLWNLIHGILEIVISDAEGGSALVMDGDIVALEKTLAIFLYSPAQISVVTNIEHVCSFSSGCCFCN